MDTFVKELIKKAISRIIVPEGQTSVTVYVDGEPVTVIAS